MSRARIVLADDHALVAEGLARLLEPHYDLVGTASDGAGLLRLSAELKPDVALVDVSMPGMNGMQAVRLLREREPEVRVIFLTMHADAAFQEEASRLGAHGYVLKRSAARELTTAIERALHAEMKPPVAAQGVFSLSERQTQVLRLLALGKQAKEIGADLNLSTKTVEFHKANLREMLGVKTTAELTRFALMLGLMAEDEAN